MEERYMYQVNTRLPITLSVGSLRSPKSVLLTKEDVLYALGKAVLFRRFSDRLEKVTTGNVDRLHNEQFMTEEEYEDFLIKQGDNRGRVVAPETPKEVVPEVKVEETVKAEPVVDVTPIETPVEEIKEDTTPTVDETETVEAPNEPAVESLSNEKVIDEDNEVVDLKDNQKPYNKKNKHHN